MITAIIQARMGSTRLPGKMLHRIAGKTVLEHVVERVRRATTVRRIIVATTVNPADRKIGSLAEKAGATVFYGSEEDVLDRYYKAARECGAETIVRVTGDCPVIDPALIDRIAHAFTGKDVDYASNALPPTFPDGMDVEVFSFSALERAWTEAVLPSEREHVTPYIYSHPERFRIANLTNAIDASALRLTLDEHSDEILIRKIIRFFKRNNQDTFGLAEILALWRKQPDFFAVNQHIRRNEGYTKSLKSDLKTERNSAGGKKG